jgi:hypothetical protein
MAAFQPITYGRFWVFTEAVLQALLEGEGLRELLHQE